MTRMSANASVGLSRLVVRTKDNLDKINNISRNNVNNISVRAREQVDTVSGIIRNNVAFLSVRARSNVDEIKSSYFERESSRSNQTQASTVSLDSFEDSDNGASKAFLESQGENQPKTKFVKAAKREVERGDS